MDSEQKRRILDAHMHLPTQGISLSEKKEILLKEMQKNGIDEGIVISDSAITSEIGSLKDCLELFSDTCYVHVVGGISPFFNYKEQCKLLDTALSEKKIVGIKLFCGHESFYLSDNILEPVYALAETYNVPVLFHSEKDSSQYASYFAVCEAVRQHPNITFVCCHCHYPNVEACFQRYKNVNNIVFDISSIADVQMTADMRKTVNPNCKDIRTLSCSALIMQGALRQIIWNSRCLWQYRMIYKAGCCIKLHTVFFIWRRKMKHCINL